MLSLVTLFHRNDNQTVGLLHSLTPSSLTVITVTDKPRTFFIDNSNQYTDDVMKIEIEYDEDIYDAFMNDLTDYRNDKK